MLLPYLVAAGGRLLDGRRAGRAARRALLGLALRRRWRRSPRFLIANPYALLDYSAFHPELAHQSTLSGEAQGKLGAPKQGGLVYYLWSLTWGLGWVPALAALGGRCPVWRREPRVALMLVPAPIAFLLFMGTEGRYFGRWLLPCCRSCACSRRSPRASADAWRCAAAPRRGVAGRAGGAPPLAAVALRAARSSLALLAQGLFTACTPGRALARRHAHARRATGCSRTIPRGTKVVVEPVSPDQLGARSARRAAGCPGTRYRWCKWPSLYTFIDAQRRARRRPPPRNQRSRTTSARSRPR